MNPSQLEQDLAFVRRAIESSQRAARVDVVPLLAWGLLTAAAAGLSYVVPAVDSVWLWVVVIGLAWAYTGWRALRRERLEPPQALASRVLVSVWGSALGAITLAGFGGYFSGAVPAASIPPIVACLFGAAFLTSSGLMQRRGVALLGLSWWAAALVLFALPAPMRLGGFGLAVLLLLVAPLTVVLRGDARG